MVVKKKNFLVLSVLFLCTFNAARSAIVGFDVGNVLLNPNRLFVARQAGLLPLILRAVWFKLGHPSGDFGAHLKETVLMRPLRELSNYVMSDPGNNGRVSYENIAYDEDGVTLLPAIFTSYLCGRIDSATFMQMRDAWFKTKPTCFVSDSDREFFMRLSDTIFNPQKFVQSQRLLGCAELLRACAQAKNPDGRPRNVVMIWSNMGREESGLLQKQFKEEIFKHVRECVFSGEQQCSKPGAEFYKKCIERAEKYTAHAGEKFCFIEDQKPNREAAQQVFAAQGLEIACAHPDQAPDMLRKAGAID